MASSGKVGGALVSVGLHALVLAWTVRDDAPVTAPPDPETSITVVEMIELPSAPSRETAQVRAPPATPKRIEAPPLAPTPRVAAKSPSRRKRARRRPVPAPVAAEPSPPAPDDAEPSTNDGDDADGQGDVDRAPEGTGRTDGTPATGRGDRGGARRGDGEATRRPGGRDEADYADYGARIVRLVMDELDRSPVPGIRPRDSIQLVLEVKPDGTLARTGSGRFDVAHVVHTSLRWLRLRQVLKRVERASSRFPDHPPGFAKSRFVVDVTVNFRPRA